MAGLCIFDCIVQYIDKNLSEPDHITAKSPGDKRIDINIELHIASHKPHGDHIYDIIQE